MSNDIDTMDNLCCPITLEIYLDPVVASDGHVYEREAIKQHMRLNKMSPVTRQVLSNELYPCYKIKSQVSAYLDANPDKRSEQYTLSKKFEDNESSIINAIIKENYDLLLNYVDYNLRILLVIITNINEMERENFFDKSNDNVLKYIIDNSIDLLNQENYFSHCLCQYASLDIIKYAMSKGIGMEVENDKKVRPIHIACQFRDLDVITAIVSNNICINLEAEDTQGWRPIHYASHFSTPNVLKYLISLGVNLDAKTNDGYKCIHFICRDSTIDMIQSIIYEHNYQLDVFDQQRCIRLIQLNENFTPTDKLNAINIMRRRLCQIM